MKITKRQLRRLIESEVLDRPKVGYRRKTKTRKRKRTEAIPQSLVLKMEYFESSPGIIDVVEYSVIDEVKNEVRPAIGVSHHLRRLDGAFNPDEVVMLAMINGCQHIYDEYLGYKLSATEWRSEFKKVTGV